MILESEAVILRADLCAALAEPRRILLLYALLKGPRNVGDLATQSGISQPATSRHLKILRGQGLVEATREGVNVEYRLSDPRLIEALDILWSVLRERVAHRASLMHELG